MSQLEHEDIDDFPQEILLNVFQSWKKCKDNHVYIDNISHATMDIGLTLEITDKNKIKNNSIIGDGDINNINKHTIYIDNCKNVTIKLLNKFNHVMCINCKNINITINEGLISGIDILNSDNITCTIDHNKIYNLSCGSSDTCFIKFNEIIAIGTIMSIANSYNIGFQINNNCLTKTYLSQMSYFDDELTYYEIKDSSTIKYMNKFGFGNCEEAV